MSSSLLDTRKPVKQILDNSAAKHDGTSGTVALCEYTLDEPAKAATVLFENMTNTKTAFSDNPTQAPHQRAFNHDLTIYDWYELPENAYRRGRFGIGMTGIGALRGESVLNEFDWNAFPKGSVVVDVGGGFGSSARYLASHAPHVSIIIQDKPEVVTAATQAWNDHSPDLLATKQVRFQSHDFFKPQPDNTPAAFILKNIIHNWGDSYNSELLSHLRTAASSDTKLLIVGAVIEYLCTPTKDAPLLPTYGILGESQYMLDMVMLNCYNAREHTAESLSRLLLKSGWKIDGIYGTDKGTKLTVASPTSI